MYCILVVNAITVVNFVFHLNYMTAGETSDSMMAPTYVRYLQLRGLGSDHVSSVRPTEV